MKMRRINQKLCLNLFGQKISRLSQRLLELLDLEREAPSTASSTVSSVSVSFEKLKIINTNAKLGQEPNIIRVYNRIRV